MRALPNLFTLQRQIFWFKHRIKQDYIHFSSRERTELTNKFKHYIVEYGKLKEDLLEYVHRENISGVYQKNAY